MQASATRINEVIRELRITGKEHEAALLRKRYENRESITDNDLSAILGLVVIIDNQTDLAVDIPPRQGKGSSTKRWREVAKSLTSLPEEVIDAWSRDDIIGHLEEHGYIPKLSV